SADAMMPSHAEGKMGIWAAVDPELVRVRKHSLVTISGIEKQRDGLPGANRLATEFDILRRGANNVPARRRPAQHFLDRGIDERGICAQPRQLFWMFD